MISVLIPANEPDYKSQLRRVIESDAFLPFAPLVIDFIDAVSKTVLLDHDTRRLPEMAAVAHWMRRAHISKLRVAFEDLCRERVCLARGVALHFAPANVDSIFLYSWFVSLLLGNANIIRLSQRRTPQVDLILGKICRLLGEQRFQPILHRSLVLSYEHDDALTQTLSEVCHIRVLWGGDESVRMLRAIPMNPMGNEIVFANRFSLAALNAEKVTRLEKVQLAKLCSQFCNDSYWFDQMACSSPRLVVWVGGEASCRSAQELFWTEVGSELSRRGLIYPEVIGLNKLVSAYAVAGKGLADRIHSDSTGAVARVHLAGLENSEFRRMECGGGFFFEREIDELRHLVPFLTEKDQTLSYFGFPETELRSLARCLPARAIDRIVPIGSALDFGCVWDGNNLLQCFSREIALQ